MQVGVFLLAVPVLLSGSSASPAPAGGDVDVLTFHGDPGRTGWNAAERALTPDSVHGGRFGKLWTAAVDGDVYAEPLVASGVSASGATRTLVVVVTENDSVYALDAADGKPVWGPVSLGAPVPRSALPCGDIDPVGITSTPVIDRESSTVYVVGLTTPDGGRTKVFKAAALDLGTGRMRPGWPVVVAPPSSSGLRFDPGVQEQRGALVLVRGAVYVPFGGYWGDCGPYHGWVVGIPAGSPGKQEAYATPTGREGGIWATGGLSADGDGNLYAATGNSDSNGPNDFGDTVLRSGHAAAAFLGRRARLLHAEQLRRPEPARRRPRVLRAARAAAAARRGDAASPVHRRQAGRRLPHQRRSDGRSLERQRDHRRGRVQSVRVRHVPGRCAGGLFLRGVLGRGDGGRFVLVPGHGRQPAPCGGTGGVAALRLGTAGGSRDAAFAVAWCSSSMESAGAPAVSSAGAEGGLVWVVDTRAGGTTRGCRYALRAERADRRPGVRVERLGRAREHAPVHHAGGGGRPRLHRRRAHGRRRTACGRTARRGQGVRFAGIRRSTITTSRHTPSSRACFS